jgi:hypothetical protein
MDRFREKVNYDGPLPERYPEAGPCHLWTASTASRPHPGGQVYGQFHADGTTVAPHSWLWRQERGPLPPGHVLDHWACDRGICVNLSHMRPATQRENILRSESIGAVNRAKTHCPQRHAYSSENTSVDATGARHCRTCARDRNRRYYATRGKELRRGKRASVE